MQKVRSLVVAMPAVAWVVALAVAWTMPTAVQPTATELILGRTLLPDPPPDYVESMTGNYVKPFHGEPDVIVPVHTPMSIWPIS